MAVPSSIPTYSYPSTAPLRYLCIMAISVKQTKKETVITVKGDLDAAHLDQAIRHLRYLSITRKFKKVSQSAADALAEEITASAHRKRQRRLAS